MRTPYGVAEVAGAAYHRLWFRIGGSTNGVVKPSTSPNSEDSKVWYFSPQQIADGRSKKLFLRCSYASNNSSNGGEQDSLPAAGTAALQFDYESISDLVDPSKWSEDMDHLLLNFLVSQSDGRQCSNSEAVWKVTADQVCENFRPLQQQLSRLAMNNHELSHKWGISGPKRKAVLARMGLLRMFNQLLEMYLPFLVTDSANSGYLPDSKASEADDFTPLQVSIPTSTINSPLRSLLIVRRSVITAGPVMKFSWEGTSAEQRQNLESEAVNAVDSQELFIGPIHAVRRRVFQHTKLAHFLEVLRCSVTKPAKTEDDYDYPDDLAHVKINRIRAFRAREAAELMHIPVRTRKKRLKYIFLNLNYLFLFNRAKICCCSQCFASYGVSCGSTPQISFESATPIPWMTGSREHSRSSLMARESTTMGVRTEKYFSRYAKSYRYQTLVLPTAVELQSDRRPGNRMGRARLVTAFRFVASYRCCFQLPTGPHLEIAKRDTSTPSILRPPPLCTWSCFASWVNLWELPSGLKSPWIFHCLPSYGNVW